MSDNVIRSEIDGMRMAGVPMRDIFVNDEDDRWGIPCAVSRKQANDIIEDWHADNGDCEASLNDLETAEDWLRRKGGAE